MQAQRARQIGAWLRNHRRIVTFFSLAVVSQVSAVCLLLLSADRDYAARSIGWMLMSLTNVTFLTGMWATAPLRPGGSERPLPRLVAGWMLATLAAQAGKVWCTLQHAFDAGAILLLLAFLLTFGGLMGVLVARAYQERHLHVDTPTAPPGPVVGA